MTCRASWPGAPAGLWQRRGRVRGRIPGLLAASMAVRTAAAGLLSPRARPVRGPGRQARRQTLVRQARGGRDRQAEGLTMAAYGTDDGLTAWLTAQGLALPAGAVPRRCARSAAHTWTRPMKRACSAATAPGASRGAGWPRAGHRANGQPVPGGPYPAGLDQRGLPRRLARSQQPGLGHRHNRPEPRRGRGKVT